MEINVLAFGVAKEIFQNDSISVELKDASTLLDLRSWIEEKYPAIKKLGSYMIAVNKEYIRDDTLKVFSSDEIAIIPPVSGG
ncbi:MAG TPA: MoaD/ThiS family protein [Puia sp.]|jgi:molybdopterin synthase sulfur carrier subunit|nr:MoaD/ThiS family protein [Puia sp.]